MIGLYGGSFDTNESGTMKKEDKKTVWRFIKRAKIQHGPKRHRYKQSSKHGLKICDLPPLRKDVRV